MIGRGLKTLVLVFLWITVVEDITLFILAWADPGIWFRIFHASVPAGFDVALLRRAAGQWIGFALAQGITLWCWRKKPVWLVVVAGVRFSDLFTDLSYIVAVPSLTKLGWFLLVPLPILNLLGVYIMLRAYKELTNISA